MPLIDLKTDLKSLKYGKDTLGGGYSGQPYIQTEIPDSFNSLGPREDFLLRGGVNAITDSLTDVKRLGKMFIDTKSPNGLLFIAKQQLLSRTAVRTQASGVLNEGIYSPLNTLAEAGVVALGGHLNKQGINPFAQTGAYATNPNLYSTRVKSYQPTDQNRLAELYRAVTDNISINNFNFSGIGLNVGNNILTYGGGPNSPLGVGKTGIRFVDPIYRTGNQNALKVSNPDYFYGKNQQRSVNENNKQVGGLQVAVENKSWIKGGIVFTAGAKTFYPNELPNITVNSPQSASLLNIPNGPLTWTPKQDVTPPEGFKYNPLNSKGISTSGSVYEKTFKVWSKETSQRDPQGNQNWYNDVYNTGSLDPYGPILTGSLSQTQRPNGRTELTKPPLGVSVEWFNTTKLEDSVSFPDLTTGGGYTYELNSFVSVYSPKKAGTFPETNKEKIHANNTWTYDQVDIISPYKTTSVGPDDPTTSPKRNGSIASPKIQDFRAILRSKLKDKQLEAAVNSGATPFAPDYNTANIENRVGLGDPGQRSGNDYANYARGVLENIGNGPKSKYNGQAGVTNVEGLGNAALGLDKINSLPVYRSQAVTDNDIKNDLVKFRIAIIDNDSPNFKTFLHFRAFLGNMSDSYSANWNGFNYLGRGEQFFTYGGFTRQISLSWTVAAQSKEELIPMYKKLNYLASTLTPDYSANGYMRGNLAQLTVGGYVYEMPGIITSLTYDIAEDSPWEIGINAIGGDDGTVKELPHIVRVTGFNFIPIHDFAPRTQNLIYNSDGKGFPEFYGDQRFISLANGPSINNSNYNSSDTAVSPPPIITNTTPTAPISSDVTLGNQNNLVLGGQGSIFG
jgi:hypothetical protein